MSLYSRLRSLTTFKPRYRTRESIMRNSCWMKKSDLSVWNLICNCCSKLEHFLIKKFLIRNSFNLNIHIVFSLLQKKGTSNWSADYFVNTGGVSFIEEGMYLYLIYNQYDSNSVLFLLSIDFNRSPNSIRGQLEQIFNRDWMSHYCESIKDVLDAEGI